MPLPHPPRQKKLPLCPSDSLFGTLSGPCHQIPTRMDVARVSLDFILDTAANTNTINAQVASELGLEAVGEALPGVGAGGTIGGGMTFLLEVSHRFASHFSILCSGANVFVVIADINDDDSNGTPLSLFSFSLAIDAANVHSMTASAPPFLCYCSPPLLLGNVNRLTCQRQHCCHCQRPCQPWRNR